jgi:tripartite-type tricarboxylate transporter receptor subunit TctC
VRRWNEALNGTLRDEAVVARLRQLGFLPFTQTPEQFGDYIRAQLASWGELVRIAGVEPQ